MPIPTSLMSGTISDLDLAVVSGAWPDDINGEMVISAPEPAPELSSTLFGFGALLRLSMRPGTHGAPADRLALRTSVIDTPSKRLFDAAPDSFVANSFGYASAFGFPNQANTAPLPWGDRLFATWDVGRPVEVDATTLGFLGEVGDAASWGAQTLPVGDLLPFHFSSAHPVIDPERDLMWTVKLFANPDLSMQVHVLAWDGNGHELRRWPIAGATVRGSSHSISQTRDWLIVADSGNFKTDANELGGGARTVTIDEGAPVYLIRKDALLATVAGTPHTPRMASVAPTTGHFFGVWDDSDGIRVLFEHMDLMDLGFQLRADDVDANGRPLTAATIGFYNMAMAPNSISEWTFDPTTGTGTRTASFREDWTYNLELSAMDWSTEGLSHPTLHHVAYQGYRPDAVTMRALDVYRAIGRVGTLPDHETPGVLATFRRDGLELADSWTYDDTGDHITSPIFVPRGAGQRSDASRYAGTEPGGHDGYVVLPVLSDDRFRVEVFDAAHVGAGPIAVAAAPAGRCLPALLHAAWMPSAADDSTRTRSGHDVKRLRFGSEVREASMARLGDELAEVVRTVARALDESAIT